MRRPLFPALALLALLASPSSAQLPAPPGEGALEVFVAAPPTSEGRVTFNVTAANGSASLHAVVSHASPTGDTVVDRIVPLRLEANTTAVVSLEGIRLGADLNVAAVDASLDLPRLPGLGLVDAEAVTALPAVVKAPLPPIDPVTANMTVLVEGHVVGAGASPRLVTTGQGYVVVGYLTGERGFAEHLALRVSSDGGHTWSREVQPLPMPRIAMEQDGPWFNGSALRWRMAALPDGRVQVVGSLLNYTTVADADGSPSTSVQQGRWTIGMLDPGSLATTSRVVAPDRDLTFDVNTYELRPLSDGTALFIFHGSATERDASGAERSWPWGPQLRVWALGLDGSIAERATIPFPENAMHSFIVDVHASDRVAILGWNHERHGGPTSVPWWTVSTDGGHAFAPIRHVEGVYPATDTQVQPQAMRMGPPGAVHLATVREAVTGPPNAVAELVRLAPGLPPKVTSIGALSHPGWPTFAFELIQKGPHLWLF